MAVAVVVGIMLVSALLAVRAKRLTASVMYLVGVSAALSVLYYLLGAWQAGAIELSVGAGLIAVLFTFVIGITEGQPTLLQPSVPRWLALGAALSVVFLLGVAFQTIDVALHEPASSMASSEALWTARQLDLLVLVVLLFVSVLAVLSVLRGSLDSESSN